MEIRCDLSGYSFRSDCRIPIRYSKVTNGTQIVCDNIIRDAKAKTGDGNIVLIHDIHENSVAGLEMALDQLSKEGYQFVTVSDLLKYKGHSEYK